MSPTDLLTLISAYRDDARKIWRESFNRLDKTEPPVLYHYTNGPGLAGIIESGQLWLTDIFKLNDPTELRHGIRIAIDQLDSGTKHGKLISGMLEHLHSDTEFEKFSRGFLICCFSSNGDDLGQWRGYGNNGEGFALGFDREVLREGFRRTEVQDKISSAISHIVYNDKVLARIQARLAKLFLNRFSKFLSSSQPSVVSKLLVEHAGQVISNNVSFKHEAYSNEKEYRFLQLILTNDPVPAFKYRMRGMSLVRYREFDWRKLAPKSLKEIVIGPAADKIKTTRFVKDCLAAYHADPDDVKIVQSNIPYQSKP